MHLGCSNINLPEELSDNIKERIKIHPDDNESMF